MVENLTTEPLMCMSKMSKTLLPFPTPPTVPHPYAHAHVQGKNPLLFSLNKT